MMHRRLEIGPGSHPLPGRWMRVSVKKGPHVDKVAAWGRQRLPFPDSHFELVYASHVLEHIPWYMTTNALKEAYRILQPGGSLEIWVPDFSIIIDGYLHGAAMDGWHRYNDERDFMKWVNGRIFAYGQPENWHKAVFTEPSLRGAMQQAGFKALTRMAKPRGYDHGVINLGIRGEKDTR